MSSFPTLSRGPWRASGWTRFKALSRMSSFPTRSNWPHECTITTFQSAVAHELISNRTGNVLSKSSPTFQSAVAHELISNLLGKNMAKKRGEGFKALSRMSSFPTIPNKRFAGWIENMFQSAVAHELISNLALLGFSKKFSVRVSKRCRA